MNKHHLKKGIASLALLSLAASGTAFADDASTSAGTGSTVVAPPPPAPATDSGSSQTGSSQPPYSPPSTASGQYTPPASSSGTYRSPSTASGSYRPYYPRTSSGQYTPHSDANANQNSARYWSQKKKEQQIQNSLYRQKTVDNLSAKGYDVSSITRDLLDASRTSDADFWAAVKSVQQDKESQDRQKKADEMDAHGYDVSSLTPDILDATKTDGATFWNTVKAAQQAKESQDRQKKANEMKVQGYDVSSLTPDILDATKTDGATFWNTVKAAQQAKESQDRQKKYEELKAKGYDVSPLTPEILDATQTDGPTFWDTVKAVQEAGSSNQNKDTSYNHPAPPTPSDSLWFGSRDVAPYLRTDLTQDDWKGGLKDAFTNYQMKMGKLYGDQTISSDDKITTFKALVEDTISAMDPYIRDDQKDAFAELLHAKVDLFVSKMQNSGSDTYQNTPPPPQPQPRPRPPVPHKNTQVLSFALRQQINGFLDRVPQDQQSVIFPIVLEKITAKVHAIESSDMDTSKKYHIVSLLKAVYQMVSERLNSGSDSALINGIFNGGNAGANSDTTSNGATVSGSDASSTSDTGSTDTGSGSTSDTTVQ